jgi:hypothetical protein
MCAHNVVLFDPILMWSLMLTYYFCN